MFCHKCGQQLDENNRFCINCGTAIVKVVPEKSIGSKQERGNMQPEYGKFVGGILLLVAALYLVLSVSALNRGAQGFTILPLFFACMVNGVCGIALLSGQVRIFDRLTTAGLVLFAVLCSLSWFICWLPWVLPGLKRRPS
jgi:hypothetical protein